MADEGNSLLNKVINCENDQVTFYFMTQVKGGVQPYNGMVPCLLLGWAEVSVA